MALDSSVFIPASREMAVSGGHAMTCPAAEFPEDKIISGQVRNTCPEIESCPATSWGYMFIHNRKVSFLAEHFEKDGNFRTFIHKSVRYRRSRVENAGVDTRPTISGLLFIQGDITSIKRYLYHNFPQYHLVNDCSTHATAVIPDSVMQPFMRIVESDPVKVRFLLNPLRKYSEGNCLVQVMTGPLAGLQGYIIRIDRDRKLVMQVGDMTVAVGGVHKEHFENVEEVSRQVSSLERQAGKHACRDLDEMQNSIDKSLFAPASFSDVLAVAANLGIWQERAAGYIGIGQCGAALEILPFLLEEIGYYFTRPAGNGKLDIGPVLDAGRAVAAQIRKLADDSSLPEDFRQELEARYEEQVIRHGYLMGIEI